MRVCYHTFPPAKDIRTLPAEENHYPTNIVSIVVMSKMLWVPVFILVMAVAAACGDSSADPPTPPSPQETGNEQEQVNVSTSVDTSTPTPGEETTPVYVPPAKVADGPLAPELVGTQEWINSSPLMLADLKGKVVLIDFWTFTCVNCIRTLPYLKLWHSKYADDGLVIIGVHTPEFDHEKVLENVQNAVERYAVDWAIVQDNDFRTWRAYENRYWPAKYLIDKDGVIRYTHFGEGAYIETEHQIRDLLEETGADLSVLNPTLPDNQPLDPSYLENRSAGLTRELYAGYERGSSDLIFGGGGYVGDENYHGSLGKVVIYQDPDEHEKHKLYLHGPWMTTQESLEHARATEDFEDYIALRFAAKSVNAVISPDGKGDDEPFIKVLVTLDGQHLDETNKGEDVVIEEDGKSFLYVDQSRMYAIVEAPSYGEYELKLHSNSPHFSIFAYTFGIYASGV